jgi:hypothetical protein
MRALFGKKKKPVTTGSQPQRSELEVPQFCREYDCLRSPVDAIGWCSVHKPKATHFELAETAEITKKPVT